MRASTGKALLRLALPTVLLIVALVAARPAVADPPCQRSPVGATCDEAWTGLFQSFNGIGWTGGDATVSVGLPNGEDAWIFGDTFLGPNNPDGTRPANFKLIHNSVVLTANGAARAPEDAAAPRLGPLVELSPATTYYWPSAGQANGTTLWLFVARIIQPTPAWFDLHFGGSSLAEIDTGYWQPRTITPIPDSLAVNWGAALLDDGPHTYIFGVENGGGWLHIARVPRGRFNGGWEYWNGRSWTRSSVGTARLLGDLSGQISVIHTAAGYHVISQQPGFGRNILAYASKTPIGPFGPPRTLYTTPDFGPQTYTNNALAHPEQTDPAGLLISYNINSFDHRALIDASLYRPRFIRVPLAALDVPPRRSAHRAGRHARRHRAARRHRRLGGPPIPVGAARTSTGSAYRR